MTSRIMFRIGDVFPAGDPLAQWLVSLSMALNDVLRVTTRLVKGLEGDGDPSEDLYGARLAGTHIWECLKLLQDGQEHPRVKAFLDALPAEAQDDYGEAMLSLDGDRWPGFKRDLARARDKFAHYLAPGNKDLKRALAATKDVHSYLHGGEQVSEINAAFADEVAVQLFFQSEDEDLDDLNTFLSRLHDVTISLVNFKQRALRAYLTTLPPGSYQVE